MNKLLPVLFLFVFGHSPRLPAQTTLSGRVIDAETRDPVPYVNIGVRALAIGTVSDFAGEFQLNVAGAESIVTFSSIGYETRDIPANALRRDGLVELTRRDYRLPTAEVVARKFSAEDEIYGERNTTRGLSVGFGSSQLGTELGALIPIEGPTFLKSANFVLNHAAGDSMLFRVNIYDYRDEKIGENLLRENIFIAAEQRRGTITVDLSPYGIVLESDVLLSLEWIRDDEGRGNVGITFDTKKARKLGGVYVKQTSIGGFEKLNYKKQLKPCFYFVGVRTK